MNAMNQGIRAITAHVPTKVFLGVLPYQIVIDFKNLHRLHSRQDLDVNLISIWEDELTNDHWICIIILPKLGEAVILDLANYHRDRYKNFIGIIQNAYKLYILKGRLVINNNSSFFLFHCSMPTIDINYSNIENKQIDNICMDMARFILRKICHEDGAFIDKDGMLMADECTNLCRWA
uniref:Uncharacterized protein n=1 Tax=Setaria italica TaxID=4555 RepID=K3ZMK8_SETIT